MEVFDYNQKMHRVIEWKLDTLENKDDFDFIVYPYGVFGKMVTDILINEKGIKRVVKVDNYNKTDGVIDCNELRKIYKDKKDNCIVFLSSCNEDIYNAVREEIYDIFDFENIIDVFSPSIIMDPFLYNFKPIMYSEPRFGTLEKAAREIVKNNVAGYLAEVGVYKGAFSRWICRCLPDRKMYLFDTFEGFDERDITSLDQNIISFNKNNPFGDTSVEIAISNIGKFYDLEVRKGYFPETAEGLDDKKFAIVSLDTDLYAPILAGLKFFWPKLSPGGYIFVHDYTWGRVRDAVIEFSREEHCGFVPITDNCNTVVFAKPY